MDELRYSKRLRAKTHSSQLIINNSNSTPPSLLLHRSLPRPPYHPSLGTVISPTQLETLRRHITAYASICQQLSLMQSSSPLTPSPPPNGTSSTPKESATAKTIRYRWAPSREQVLTLERIYDTGVGTPSKEQVREITSELSKYGPVTETRVYNWFQNRKAKSRRKNREEETDVKEKASPTLTLGPSSQSRGEAPGVVRVFLDGEPFDAPAGCFNVKQVFGEGAELLAEQEQLVPVDRSGMTFQPLVPGLRYRLKVRPSGDEVSESDRSRCDTQEQVNVSSEPSEPGTGPADIMHEQSVSVDENMSLLPFLTLGNYKLTGENTSEKDAAGESFGEPSTKVFAKRSMLPVHKPDSPNS